MGAGKDAPTRAKKNGAAGANPAGAKPPGARNVVPTIRAFAAMDLDAMSVRRVMRVADRLRMASGAPSAAWTSPDKVHVTLKFMGDLPADAVGPVGEALEALVDPKKAPRPGACSLQAFPTIELAEIIVLELTDPAGDLAKLARKLEKVAARHGVAPETRVFRPHITLARLKRPYDTRRWLRPGLAEATGEFTPSRLALYRSEPGVAKDGGSLYVPLATFDFDAVARPIT
ncbi:MAG TPA: RNA 2',3'-cyclic phosphodiesterase [Polyangiaceae bacterium]|jgi:2'-5' RNA ligase|nr:RNA 2',3'-cyclic phosphodiesterase [Polyangiaceae bacterium]